MAAGRPVVARRVGALPETVEHGVTGWLIDDERPDAVAQALGRVLADRDEARAMGLAGRRRVERDFSPQRAVAIVEDVYRALA
jgi:glycosyltransferase involved in cell wall biosynthesis